MKNEERRLKKRYQLKTQTTKIIQTVTFTVEIYVNVINVENGFRIPLSKGK